MAVDFEKTIKTLPHGVEIYARLASAGIKNSQRRVLLRSDNGPWLAYFSCQENAIYFNSRFIAGFFGVRAKGYKDREMIEIMLKSSKARAEFVKRADSVYLHELVHALQSYLYPEYSVSTADSARETAIKGKGTGKVNAAPSPNFISTFSISLPVISGQTDATLAVASGSEGAVSAIPLEFEYEAYFTEDLYTHEKMKRSPKLLKAVISGAYYDLYTENALGSYLTLSLDPAAYRERIRKKYEDEVGGYLGFEEAEIYKKNSVQDAKILSYASGRLGDYIGETAALALLQLEKAAYSRYLEDFYLKRWPPFSAEALLFIGSAALEVKNYPLALDCLAVADENAVKSGLPLDEQLSLKTKGALAILEAADFIRDRAKNMSLEILSQHLKAVEKACLKTSRPFPTRLLALREKNYPKAAVWYSKKAGLEKDSDKAEYYSENFNYFSSAMNGAGLAR